MRHALAPGGGDPADFQLNACSTQRNLNDRGREQARSVGRAFKAAGIVFTQVLTSQWCRCRETAALLDLGAPSDFPGLNSFFQDRSTADAQTEEVKALLKSMPQSEKVMLVTHQVNITALTGQGVSSGEVFLIKLGPDGKVEVIGEFLIPPP
ncbi:MAG: histidine phosphatase family protein [Rhizobiales bacterium]|nr:histidine phosphatase family protein [Hyphomicrobiales bacterium]